MITELTSKLEASNAELTKTLNEIEQKKNELEQVKTNMNQSVSELTTKVSTLEHENNELNNGQKQVNIELSSLKQQMAKDKQHYQCQISAQTMAYETKIQQMQQEMRIQSHKALQNVFSIVQENLGPLYGLDPSDFNEETLKQLVLVVKNDLDKLKYFQNETTQFPPKP